MLKGLILCLGVTPAELGGTRGGARNQTGDGHMQSKYFAYCTIFPTPSFI